MFHCPQWHDMSWDNTSESIAGLRIKFFGWIIIANLKFLMKDSNGITSNPSTVKEMRFALGQVQKVTLFRIMSCSLMNKL